MLPIRTILCPTDFSDSARSAFEFASALARDYRAALVVVHVVQPPVFAAEGIALPVPIDESYELRARLIQLHPVEPGTDVEYHILHGDAGNQIVNAARDAKANLIVMGTHGKSGLTRLLMGSVAESVMRHAPCAVLTVRGSFHLPLASAVTPERRTLTGVS